MPLSSDIAVMMVLIATLMVLSIHRVVRLCIKKQKSPKVDFKELILLILPATGILALYSMLRFYLNAPNVNINILWIFMVGLLLVVVNFVVVWVIDRQLDSAALKIALAQAEQARQAQEQYYQAQEQYLLEQQSRADSYKQQLELLQSMTAPEDSALQEYLAQLLDKTPTTPPAVPPHCKEQ